ncbi:MAG: glycosyltransferase [Ilyomonas sp.]
MIKALWLTSWYPNKKDEWNGDFIQRHAKAVAAFCKTDVIHVEGVEYKYVVSEIDASRTSAKNLSEIIILFKKRNRHFIDRLTSYHRYLKIYKQELEFYFAKNGKPEIVHVHIPMKAGIIALWLKRKYNLPYVVTEHWTIYKSNAIDNYRNRSFLFKYYTKKIFVNALLFLPVSNDLGKTIQRVVARVPYKVVPNVVDTTQLFYKPYQQKEFVFLHVSTLNYQKNPEAILKVFDKFCSIYSNCKLVMAGPASKELIALSKHLTSAEKIYFTGEIPYAQVASEMQKSNAFILFSRFENLPCVILEALCCGLPVISTNVGGVSEVVNKSDGLLIESQNEEQLFQAMRHIFIHYSSYDREAISKNATEKFNYNTIGKQIVEIYQSLINNTKAKV